MNTQRHRLPMLSTIVLLAFALLWFAWPSQVNARLASPETIRFRNGMVPSSPSSSPGFALAAPITFTLSLPLVMKGLASPTNQCGPGQTITDPLNDVAPAYIDVTSVSTTLNGERLEAILHLRDVPPQLTFDRPGVPQGYHEYQWAIYADADNNLQTGSGLSFYKGADFEVGAIHSVQSPGASITQPISNALWVRVWQYIGSNTWTPISDATLSVDPWGDTMTLSGNIPGIAPTSRLFFYTYDYNPGGTPQRDQSSCGQIP